MRKLFILISVLVISLTLVGCTGNDTDIIEPTFVGLTVNGINPMDGTDYATFYEGKQGELLVEVTFTNPSKAPIKSVSINGYTYSSSRFTDNSTDTVKYFIVNVGDVLAQTIYSLDRFSYLDGENAKDVVVNSNNEFSVYVFKDLPSITRESYSLDKNEININFVLSDIDSVITAGSLRAVIYEGEEEGETIVIDPNNPSVSFTGLDTDNNYEIKVYATYDIDDEIGVVNNDVLYSDAYSTLSNSIPSAEISNVDFNSSEVEFDVNIIDDDSVIVPGELYIAIYNGDVEEARQNITGSKVNNRFINLYSNTEYTVKIMATYDLDDGNAGGYEDKVIALYTFPTLPLDVPLPQIVNLNVQENNIDFDVVINDPLGIILLDTLVANIYVDGEEFIVGEVNGLHVDFLVSNLLADTEFTIELVSSIDLKDSDDSIKPNHIITTEVFNTTDNDIPSVTVNDMIIEQGYVTVGLNVSNPSLTLDGPLTAKLYEGNSVVDEFTFISSTEEIVFAYETVSGLDYYIEISADYNLRDGLGTKTEILKHIILASKEPKIPVAELTNIVLTQSTIEFDVVIRDADNTIIPNTTFVRIYVDGSLLESIPLPLHDNNVTISTDILSNKTYEIIIVTDYDLNENPVTPIIYSNRTLHSEEMTTLANGVPVAEINPESDDFTTESIVVDIDITDPNGTIIPGSMKATIYNLTDLLNNEGQIDLLDYFSNNVTFPSLSSNSEYVVIVSYQYNLLDGNGVITVENAVELQLATNPKTTPEVNFGTVVATSSTITLNIDVIDPSEVIDGDLFAILYDSQGETLIIATLNRGLNPNVIFNVLSNEVYQIYIIADYDMNDDINDFDNKILAISDSIITDSLSPLVVEVSSLDSTLNEVSFDVLVTDNDSVIKSGLSAVIYDKLDLLTPIATKPVTAGVVDSIQFDSLNSDTDYVVVITATYDYNEQAGEVTGPIDSFEVKTKTQVPPTSTISDLVINEDQVSFVLEIDDLYNVLKNNTLRASLFLEGNPVAVATKLVSTSNVSFSLENFLASQNFTVVITGEHNLLDGAGDVPGTYGSYEFTTLAFDAPSATIISVNFLQNSIDALIIVSDSDETSTKDLVAKLYDKDHNLLRTIALSVGTNYISFDVTANENEFYAIEVSSDYNLRDGAPEVDGEILYEHIEYIDSLLKPEADIISITPNKTSIDLIIDVYDIDNTIIGGTTVVELYLDGVLQATSAPISGLGVNITFNTDIRSDREYVVVIKTDYEISAAIGTQYNKELYSTSTITLPLEEPETSVDTNSVQATEMEFDIAIIDNEGIITLQEAVLYEGFTEVGRITIPASGVVGFSNLQGATIYRLVVELTYNNNVTDESMLYEVATEFVTTEDASIPTGSINSLDITNDTITVKYSYLDSDNVDVDNEQYLVLDDGTTQVLVPITQGANSLYVFDDLAHNTNYTITITSSYDLNDNNDYTDEVLAITNDSTKSFVVISDEDTLKTRNQIDISFDDLDGLVTSTTLQAKLYEGGTEIATYIITKDIQTTLDMIQLYSGYDYSLDIIGDFTDAGVSYVNEIIYTYEFTTTPLNLPVVAIDVADDWEVNTGVLNFDVTIGEDDSEKGTVEDTTWHADIYEDGLFKETVVFTADDLGVTDFNIVAADNDYDFSTHSYTIVILGNVDLNDGTGASYTALDSRTFFDAGH